jgi:uncharacterized protein
MSTQSLADTDTAECQASLAHLWEKNLGVPVGTLDDYFDRGGDSLRGTELLTWIYDRFGVELSLLDLFESRTIAAQTDLLLGRMRTRSTGAVRPKTEYRYFGPDHKRLFGALHHSQTNDATTAVVLCYPMGQEYMRIHRTYVELARNLAESGLEVLRFDYYGCGDSAGETTDGTLQQWADDILQAIRELRMETGLRGVHLVGSRIGANLALRVAQMSPDVAGVVLWEPVLNGVEYLATLEKAHDNLLHNNAKLDGYNRTNLWFVELVGYPFTKELYDELAAIDLCASPVSATPDVLVLANTEKPRLQEYANWLRSQAARVGTCVDYISANESDAIWLKEDRQNKGVVPARAVQTIVSWLGRRN